MESIVEKAVSEINELEKSCAVGKHVVTNDIRRLSSKLFRELEDKTIENVLSICEELLEQHSWALGIIAFDFAYRVKNQYTEATYDTFYLWLKKYIRGWGDCDDFCTHAFGELLRQNKNLFSKVILWTKDADFWVRRASAVILIPCILKNDYEGINPFVISDNLLEDEHDLVLKGYGWMLKCLSTVNRDCVEIYLRQNYQIMPRVAFRYALEKFDKNARSVLMNLK